MGTDLVQISTRPRLTDEERRRVADISWRHFMDGSPGLTREDLSYLIRLLCEGLASSRTATTNRIAEQTLAEVAQNRVRLPGYYDALAAQQLLSEGAPSEFDAEQISFDANSHGVYVLFWRTPQRGQA